MRAIVERGNLLNRTMRMPSGAAIATFVAVIALALAEGGSSPTAFGAATVVIWLAVVVTLVARRDAPAFTRELIWVTGLLALLLGLTALSLEWGTDAGAGFADVARLSGYLGVVVLCALHLRPGSGRALLEAIALAAVCVAVVALGSRLTGIGSGDAGLAELLPLSAGRLSFPIGYWNALGALMALSVPALAYLAVQPGARRAQLWLAAGVPVIVTAYMTQSRGALLAVLLGAGVAIAASRERSRISAALAVAVVAAVPACLAASFAPGIRDSVGEGAPGGSEVLVGVMLLAGTAIAFLFGAQAVERAGRSLRRISSIRIRARYVVPAAAALLAVVIALGGPGRLVDDFNTLPADPRATATSGILSASGSGRAQFWDTALEAFADEPVRGIGAGGFATYWNRFGSLSTPVRDVHSEPLELLAELGLVGALAFLGIFGVALLAGARTARAEGGGAAAAALGVMAAGSVGFLIDFTWQVPAVAVPLLIVLAGLAGSAFEPSPEAAAGRRPVVSVPAPLLALGLTALAIASIWAGSVVAIADSKLAESREALAAGDASGAASAARAAIAAEPWAAEPWLQLADIERSVDNLAASQRAAEEAIERSPDDFRNWALLALVEAADGNFLAGSNHGLRSIALAPLLLERLEQFVPSGP